MRRTTICIGLAGALVLACTAGASFARTATHHHAARAVVTATERASVSSTGAQARRWSGWNGKVVEYLDVSADGRYVAFGSGAPNLVPRDTNGFPDIFVRDTVRNRTTRVSVSSNGTQGNRRSYLPVISANGRYIAFSSRANNLSPADDNRTRDAYVHDRVTHRTRLVSIRADGKPITKGTDEWVFVTSISDDGQRVVFETAAPAGPGDGRSNSDVFVRDLSKDKTILVSHRRPGEKGGADAEEGAISGNGRYVAFTSLARNLPPAGEPILGDVYVRDLRTDKLTTASAGFNRTPESRHSATATLSGNGRYIVFQSLSRNLLEEPSPNTYWTSFVRNLHTGETWRLSANTGVASISLDGNLVAFSSDNQLVPEDTDENVHVYVWNRTTGTFTAVNLQPDGTLSVGDPYAEGDFKPAITADGTAVAFSTTATDLVQGDTNDVRDVFIAPIGGPE